MDTIDPGFAPGTGTPEPGGLHPSVERATRLDGPIESRYFLAADDRLVGLYCNTTPDRLPDDRWVSIAETIEFLPAEE
jgi:hypothetical protein